MRGQLCPSPSPTPFFFPLITAGCERTPPPPAQVLSPNLSNTDPAVVIPPAQYEDRGAVCWMCGRCLLCRRLEVPALSQLAIRLVRLGDAHHSVSSRTWDSVVRIRVGFVVKTLDSFMSLNRYPSNLPNWLLQALEILP